MAKDSSLSNSCSLCSTAITDLETVFVGEETLVTASGLEWNETGAVAGSENILWCETFVNGEAAGKGNVSLVDVGRELPDSVDCGTFTLPNGGRYTIDVVVTVDESDIPGCNRDRLVNLVGWLLGSL